MAERRHLDRLVVTALEDDNGVAVQALRRRPRHMDSDDVAERNTDRRIVVARTALEQQSLGGDNQRARRRRTAAHAKENGVASRRPFRFSGHLLTVATPGRNGIRVNPERTTASRAAAAARPRRPSGTERGASRRGADVPAGTSLGLRGVVLRVRFRGLRDALAECVGLVRFLPYLFLNAAGSLARSALHCLTASRTSASAVSLAAFAFDETHLPSASFPTLPVP